MTVELPQFVDKTFLNQILRTNYDEKIDVKSFWGEFATKAGENYASLMYRIHISCDLDGKSEIKKILFKVMRGLRTIFKISIA